MLFSETGFLTGLRRKEPYKIANRGWRNGLAVKRTNCFCQGPRLDYQHSCWTTHSCWHLQLHTLFWPSQSPELSCTYSQTDIFTQRDTHRGRETAYRQRQTHTQHRERHTHTITKTVLNLLKLLTWYKIDMHSSSECPAMWLFVNLLKLLF